MHKTLVARLCTTLVMGLMTVACGSDDPEQKTEADILGVGAQCSLPSDCQDEQTCLPFKGGYCGVPDRKTNADCPDASGCVAHSDGKNYCFRLCQEKVDCNANRDEDNRSNCSSNITFVDSSEKSKACIPPS